MIGSIAEVLHPEGYHGNRKGFHHFEGWYFKAVDATERHRYAIIPGISLGEGDPHSFVQVLEVTTGSTLQARTLYKRYPVEAFSAAETQLDVRVGPNHFTQHRMEIDLTDSDLPLQGALDFLNPRPWPVTPLSPGIMGWYAWAPKMECYHGVLSLDHSLRGTLRKGSRRVSFDGGRGYIEKDWGQSFPSGWVWMQTNHFERSGISLTASIATIPWMGSSFIGFIVGLLWQGTLYRFATYTGAKTVHLAIDNQSVHWVIEDPLYRLTLLGHSDTTGHLRGPSKTDMGRPVPETLSATVDVELAARTGQTRADRVLFTGTGRYAGMEVVGNSAALCFP